MRPRLFKLRRQPVRWATIASPDEANPEILRLFLDHGADVRWRDKAGRGPVDVAVERQGGTIPQGLAREITRSQEGGRPVPEEMRKLVADLKQADPQAVPSVPEPAVPGSDDMARILDEVGLDKPGEARR